MNNPLTLTHVYWTVFELQAFIKLLLFTSSLKHVELDGLLGNRPPPPVDYHGDYNTLSGEGMPHWCGKFYRHAFSRLEMLICKILKTLEKCNPNNSNSTSWLRSRSLSHIYSLNIMLPCDLDLWPLDIKTGPVVRLYVTWATFTLILNFLNFVFELPSGGHGTDRQTDRQTNAGTRNQSVFEVFLPTVLKKPPRRPKFRTDLRHEPPSPCRDLAYYIVRHEPPDYSNFPFSNPEDCYCA